MHAQRHSVYIGWSIEYYKIKHNSYALHVSACIAVFYLFLKCPVKISHLFFVSHVFTSSLVFQGLPYSSLKTQSYLRSKWHHLIMNMKHVIKTLEKTKNACRNGRVVFCITFEVADTLIDGILCISMSFIVKWSAPTYNSIIQCHVYDCFFFVSLWSYTYIHYCACIHICAQLILHVT